MFLSYSLLYFSEAGIFDFFILIILQFCFLLACYIFVDVSSLLVLLHCWTEAAMLFFSFFRKHIQDILQEHFINIQVTSAYVECSACRNSVVWCVYFASLIAISKLKAAEKV